MMIARPETVEQAITRTRERIEGLIQANFYGTVRSERRLLEVLRAVRRDYERKRRRDRDQDRA